MNALFLLKKSFFLTVAALVLVTAAGFHFSLNSTAHAAGMPGVLNSGGQNAMGDVTGPQNGGFSNSLIPLPSAPASTLPSASALTSGISSGLLLPNLQGAPGLSSMVSNILSTFNGLPSQLQPIFLQAITNTNLLPSQIPNLLTQFQTLSGLFQGIGSLSCASSGSGALGVTQSSFATFAMNSLASQINPSSLFSFSSLTNPTSMIQNFTSLSGLSVSSLTNPAQAIGQVLNPAQVTAGMLNPTAALSSALNLANVTANMINPSAQISQVLQAGANISNVVNGSALASSFLSPSALSKINTLLDPKVLAGGVPPLSSITMSMLDPSKLTTSILNPSSPVGNLLNTASQLGSVLNGSANVSSVLNLTSTLGTALNLSAPINSIMQTTQTIGNALGSVQSLTSMFSSSTLTSALGFPLSSLNLSSLNPTNILSGAQNFLGGLAGSLCPGSGSSIPGLSSLPGIQGTNLPTGTPVPPGVAGPTVAGVSACDPKKTPFMKERSAFPGTYLGKNYQSIMDHIKVVASNIGMPPETLAGIIWLESIGGNPQASVNKCSGSTIASATGLIQFVNKTAVGLGMHGKMSCSQHVAFVRAMSVGEQMKYVEKYFNSCGWQAGMSDIQAYRCVHSGSPGSSSVDSVNGKSTDQIFNTMVLPKIEALRCQPGAYDWNTMSWTVNNGATSIP